MKKHLVEKTKPCPKTVADVELTDEIKCHILNNRIWAPPKEMTATQSKRQRQVEKRMEKLEFQLEVMKTKKSEKFFQTLLEDYIGGQHCAIPCMGISDITTDRAHVEIKEWKNWKSSMGQLLAYNFGMKKEELAAYLFSTKPDHHMKCVKCMQEYGIQVFDLICDKGVLSVYSFQTNEVVHTVLLV